MTTPIADLGSASAPDGKVFQVSVSPGGVPKLPVERAWVGELGVEGDRQRHDAVHGGPHRAVALLAIESIERVQADGHPIEPGSTGENLTTSGIELSLLPVGTRLAIGERLVLELAGPANPCNLIEDSFRGGKSGRISIITHPTDSRMYARTLVEGEVRAGDPIRVLPPAAGTMAEIHRRLDVLDSVERDAWLALWDAAADAGLDVRIVDDGDFAAAASPDLPGSTFNRAFGMRQVPALLPHALDLFHAARTTGWILDVEPPVAGSLADEEIVTFVAELDGRTGDEAGARAVPGVSIRAAAAANAADWGRVMATAEEPGHPLARAWPRISPGLAATRGQHMFLAELDGRPIGAAAIFVRRRVGWLGGATVETQFRGRGIQRAVIAHRIQVARALRCTSVMATATAGSVSAANLEALGLAPFWRRWLYRVEPSS